MRASRLTQSSNSRRAFSSNASSSSSSRRPLVCRASQRPTNADQPGAAQDRRRALLLKLASIPLAAAAAASQLAVAGPAAADNNAFTTWWRSRRSANGGAKLLNPLYVAQRRLRQADSLLQQSSTPDVQDLNAALQLVRSSSLNCYLFEASPTDSIETKASLLTAKLELSDPCTFRIVLKNTVDLEPPAVQAAATDKMEALVLSYQHLDSLLEMALEGKTDAVPKAQEQLKATMLIASDIEAFVKQTLGV